MIENSTSEPAGETTFTVNRLTGWFPSKSAIGGNFCTRVFSVKFNELSKKWTTGSFTTDTFMLNENKASTISYA